MWYVQKKRAMKSAVITAAKEMSGKDEPSKEDILEVLFSEEYSNDFYVYWWDNPWETDKTIWQRLNYLWFVPIFFVFIAPVQWITKGKVGFDQRTKIGEIILKMLGEK